MLNVESNPWLFYGGFAALKLAIQLAFIQGYGWFRDEFYYLACSRHLDFGYVDHPPLAPALLASCFNLLARPESCCGQSVQPNQ